MDASDALWSKSYGGTEDDVVSSMVATSDGGFVITGYTESFGAGKTDVWLVKTDGEGNMVWNKTYGGPNNDYGASVQQTSDGGYIIAGYTGWSEELPYDKSDPFYIIPANRPHELHFDAYLIKTDVDGNLMWNRTYSSEGLDYAHSVKQTADGGYVLTGGAWLVKTDKNGDVEWSRTYGEGCGYSVQQTSDGGYLIGGYRSGDFLLIKTDTEGYVTWNKTYDIGREDHAFSAITTSDGGYLVAGLTHSSPERIYDAWLVKTGPDGNMEWNRTYGGAEQDSFRSVQQTSDGGYIMAGSTTSFDKGAWLVKTDSDGNVLWNYTYKDGGSGASVVETLGGGYVVAGSTASIGAKIADFLLFKVDYVAPQITVTSPVNGSHISADLTLDFVVSEPVTWMSYSLDGQENVTFTENTTISGLPDGSHSLVFYAEDYAGNTQTSDPLYFTVDTVVPTVSIIEPKTQTYLTDSVSLTFTSDEPLSLIEYSLDGQANMTIQGNTTLSDFSTGTHNLTVYITDAAGNTGKSETLSFTVITIPFVVCVTVAVAIVCVTVVLYFTKIRKTKHKN